MSYKKKPELLPLSILSGLEGYRQVKNHANLAKASSPYYTRSPEMQPVRWHIWYDGAEVVSLLCEGDAVKTWKKGPDIAEADLFTGDRLVDHATGILDGLFDKHYKGLGVIVHLADSDVQNTVIGAYDNLEKFDDVERLAIDSPSTVVLGAPQDASLYRWRAFPIEGATENKIVLPRLASGDMAGVKALCEIDAPITVSVRNAQVEAITVTSRLAECIPADGIDGETPFARLIILHYRRTTNLTIQDSRGVPLATRQLTHPEGRLSKQMTEEYQLLLNRVPAGIANLHVVIFHFAGEENETLTLVESELKKIQASGKLDIVIQTMPRELMPQLIRHFAQSTEGLDDGVVFPAEFSVEYADLLVKDDSGGDRRHTERMLSAASDSFLDESTDIRDSVVTSSDARLFLMCKAARWSVNILIVLAMIYASLQVFLGLRSKAWAIEASDVSQVSAREQMLKKTLADYNKTASALAPKNTLWQNMELVLALFPEGKDVELTDARFTYDAKTKTSHWTFDGSASEAGMAYVRNLQNPATVSDLISSVSASTGARDGIFDPTDVKNVSLQETKGDNAQSSDSNNGRNISFVLDLAISAAGAKQE